MLKADPLCRYDNMIGQFSASGTSIPSVGCSVGIERVFDVMEQRRGDLPGRTKETQVFDLGVVPF